MKLLIVSGMSGSGKSIALNTLEDLDYYCIDNLPVGMLSSLLHQTSTEFSRTYDRIAVGIDARNSLSDLQNFPTILGQLRDAGMDCTLLFLQAEDDTLLKRFSETRRKHPLTRTNASLADAIRLERQLLEPIASNADLIIDTSHTNVHELRGLVRDRVAPPQPDQISLLFQSFGYKHGVPSDADFIFDSRCLPNPHWQSTLRPYTGRDTPVIEYLSVQPAVMKMTENLITFLEEWIPHFEQENRSYLTIALGCTGGQHRSVYLAETLAAHFREKRDNVLVRHRELP